MIRSALMGGMCDSRPVQRLAMAERPDAALDRTSGRPAKPTVGRPRSGRRLGNNRTPALYPCSGPLRSDRATLHPAVSYTHPDAADDLLCVDLGGRRIIKK